MKKQQNSISVSPQFPESKWVALDINDSNKIVAEDVNPETVIEKANKTGKSYSLLFIPRDGQYIF